MSCPEHIEVLARSVCLEVLSGPWSTSSDKIEVSQIQKAGLFCELYKCSVLDDVDDTDNREVVLRKYDMQDVPMRNALKILEENDLGPKIHGLSDGWCLEQNFESHSWSSKDKYKVLLKSDPTGVAQRLVELHKLEDLANEEEIFLDKELKSCSEFFKCIPDKEKLHPDVVDVLESVPIMESITWVNNTLEEKSKNKQFPVVFSLNGLPGENILSDRNDEDNFDAESLMFGGQHCTYNYRGFDIANFFSEYSDSDREEKMKMFIGAYLEGITKSSPSDEDIESLFEEVNFFVPVSHLLWGLKALKKGHNPSTESEWPSCEIREFVVDKLSAFANEKY